MELGRPTTPRFPLSSRSLGRYQFKTGAVNYLKVVAPVGEPCVMPTPDASEWYMRWSALAPTWRNQVTLESLEKIREFDPVSLIHLISPVPVLMIAAEQDSLLPLRVMQAAYERAAEPKSLLALPCGHFEIYDGQWGEKAAGAAIEWFGRHLRAG